MIYNKRRHIELLKISEDLKKQKKSLFTQNRADYDELLRYNTVIGEHIFWQDRYQLILLHENFLNRKIDIESFRALVYEFRRQYLNKCEKFRLELISNSEKIKDFQLDKTDPEKDVSGFLTALFCECEYFADADNYSDEKFYETIKIGFLNFQEALNEK